MRKKGLMKKGIGLGLAVLLSVSIGLPVNAEEENFIQEQMIEMQEGGQQEKAAEALENEIVNADETIAQKDVNMSAMNAETNIETAVTREDAGIDELAAVELTDITLSGTYLYSEAWEVLDLVNKERASAGLPALTMDKDLLAGAMKRAIEVQVYFSHTRPNGQSCFTISNKASGENIAAGNSTATGTMQQWMNSPGHRGNILNSRYSSIGIGCFTQGGVRYWVQLFGTSEAAYTDERQNIATTESVSVISNNIRCQMNIGNPYPLMRGEKEDYDGKFVLINNGWQVACTWILPTTVNWNSSDKTIFQVDSNGHMKGVKVGEATLTAQLKNRTSIQDSIKIQVYDPYGLEAVKELKAVSAGKQKVVLSWQGNQNAEGYLIYAQKKGKYGYCGMTTKGTTFTDTQALDNDYNFYWVFPYVKDNYTGKMIPGPCEKYVFAKGIIPAVQNLRASSVQGGVKLNWSVQVDAEGYLIYGRRAAGKYEYVGMTTKGTSFTDKKASKTNYNYYWVYPYYKNGSQTIIGGTPKYTYGRAL